MIKGQIDRIDPIPHILPDQEADWGDWLIKISYGTNVSMYRTN